MNRFAFGAYCRPAEALSAANVSAANPMISQRMKRVSLMALLLPIFLPRLSISLAGRWMRLAGNCNSMMSPPDTSFHLADTLGTPVVSNSRITSTQAKASSVSIALTITEYDEHPVPLESIARTVRLPLAHWINSTGPDPPPVSGPSRSK